jgi:hypothetical protein
MNKTTTKKSSYDLYISYNPAQINQVKQICKLFEDNKFRIWFIKFEIFDSNNDFEIFDEMNIYALESSCIFVCFPSNEYKKSLKNRIEYAMAIEQDMKIISLDLSNSNVMPNSVQIKLSHSLIGRPNSNEFKMILDFIRLEIRMSETFKQSTKQPITLWFRSFQNIRNNNNNNKKGYFLH